MRKVSKITWRSMTGGLTNPGRGAEAAGSCDRGGEIFVIVVH